MEKEVKFFLEHIRENIQNIEEFVEGFSEEDFSRDIKTQSAVMRKIEIIGEAVKNISSSLKKKHPEVKWKELAGMRDKLIHHYFSLEMSVVWNTVKEDIPILKEQINKILNSLE